MNRAFAAFARPHRAGPTAGANTGCKYTIKCGDTLWAISQAQNTTVQAIQALNPGLDPAALLAVGTTIKVPCQSCRYTVKFDDFFWAIFLTGGSTVQDIQYLNPGFDPAALAVGATIKVSCAYLYDSGRGFGNRWRRA